MYAACVDAGSFQERAPSPSSVACDFLIGYRELTRSLGGDADGFLRRAGIDPAVLARKEARVPTAALSDLLERTAAALDCPDFGMRLAEVQGARPFEPLDPLISNAPTVGWVLACACEHSEAYSCGITTTLERDGPEGRIFFRTEIPEEIAGHVQLVEQMALLAHYGVIRLSGGRARAREIWFLHSPRSPTTAYARRFGAPVRFQQDLHGLFLHDADLDAPVVDCNEGVFLLERKNFAARFPPPQIPLATRVRQAVERAFAEGCCTRERVAELMEMHERTLHRRLSASGTSFQDIREQVRRKLVLRYLSEPSLSLTDVTGRLGYSELPVLTRACQRWFKATPAELRRRLMGHPRKSRRPDELPAKSPMRSG